MSEYKIKLLPAYIFSVVKITAWQFDLFGIQYTTLGPILVKKFMCVIYNIV